MSCTDCASNEIKYKGDGSQVLFTFPFTYIDQDDVYVELFNYSTRRWVDANDPSWLGAGQWSFANATTIEFTTAPDAPVDETIEEFNIKISRCTDIDPLSATFYPGSAIRAQDLNNNFEQLQFAIQESRCKVPDWLFDYLEENYWNKFEDLITEEQQTNGSVVSQDLVNDEHVFSAAASAARHDAYVQDTKPADLTYEQLGKIWNDTDAIVDYYWDSVEETWVSFTKSAPPGPQGDFGPPGRVIVSDFPPTQYPATGDNEARPLESGDLWFNSNLVMLYVYYVDNTGPQWVSVAKTGPQGPAGPSGPEGGIQEAPNDGTLYGRQNEQWVEAQEVFTADSPLQMSNTNELQFVWSSMNSLP
jgi:hypothetical protein